jgi:hypothetical protein
LRDWRSDVIWPEDDGGAVWSRTRAKERVVGYARAEVARVRSRERAESSMCSDVLGCQRFSQELEVADDEMTYGGITVEPRSIAALDPTTVKVNGFCSISRLSTNRDWASTVGMNKDPTANHQLESND